MRAIANFFKFFVGFSLGIALLAGGVVFGAYYFFTRLTAPPPRPVFANDKPATTAAPNPQATPASAPAAAQPQPTPSPTPSPEPTLKPGEYQARVSQPIGLILRDGPSREAGQVGGIEYNERVIVLEESSDKEWQRVRVENSDREGWVRGGNTERVN